MDKQRLHQHLLDKLDSEVLEIKSDLQRIIESRNKETKSSAGDKFETGRSMLQNEEANARKRLGVAEDRRHELRKIVPTRNCLSVVPGALVQTSLGLFYICIAVGKLSIEGKVCFGISLDSPIGKRLSGRKAGETFVFNGTQVKISELR